MPLIIMSFNFSSKVQMCSFVESCLLRLILDSADNAMGVDKGGQEADTVRGSSREYRKARKKKNLKNSKT